MGVCLSCCRSDSKPKVKLFNPTNTTASHDFVKGLRQTVNELEFIDVENNQVLYDEVPLIVVCPFSSRLQPDVDLVISSVKLSSQYVVIVLHVGSKSNLPVIPSGQKLSGYDNVTFVDMGFSLDGDIFECQHNNDAKVQLISFVREYYIKKADGHL